MCALLVSALLAAPAHGQAPPDALAQIKSLKCRRAEQSIGVSFRVEGALGAEEIRDLASGITLTFTHTLHLVRRRKLFFDKQLVKRVIETSATLDTLTQQYALRRKADDGTVESSTTDRREIAERWLTEIHNQVLAVPPGNERGTLELRVSTDYRKNLVLFFWPSSIYADGETECR